MKHYLIDIKNYLSNVLLMLLGPSRCSSTEPFIDHRIGALTEQLNFAGWRSDNHRHPLPVAVEFQDVQQLKAVLNAFERNLWTSINININYAIKFCAQIKSTAATVRVSGVRADKTHPRFAAPFTRALSSENRKT